MINLCEKWICIKLTAHVFLVNHLQKLVKEWNKSKQKPIKEWKNLKKLLMVSIFTVLKWIWLVKSWKYLENIPVFTDTLIWLTNAWDC